MSSRVKTSRPHSEVVSERTPAEHEGLEVNPDELHNLPASLTSFIGRSDEVAEVKSSLATRRLLTLTGAGGLGKSRLALEIAREALGDYADGVWVVEFAPISDPDLIPQTVAAALGVREISGRSLTDALVAHLRRRKLLLVLDNCEHLVEGTAGFTDALLRSCEDLRILATSREPLGNLGEAVWPVPPLSLLDEGTSSAEAIAESEAGRLFVERARSRRPGFGITRENAASVARVCRRLDGIPLAIELVTARMGVLAVEQIVERLDDSLKILAVKSHTTELRHRTMRATIEWSYDLLEEQERALFRRLSVFAGGWTIGGAEEVCEGDGLDRDEILDLLSRLVEKSLVEPSESGGMRYRMLEPVRQYALELLLECEDDGRVRERHALYFLKFAERGGTVAEKRLVLEGRSKSWHRRMEGEYANLSAALSWALYEEASEHAASIGMRLTLALFWLWHSHQIEGRRYLERALSVGDPENAGLKARALHGLSWITFFQGDHDAARTRIEQSVALYRRAGDPEALASGLIQFGMASVLGERDDVPMSEILEELERMRPGIENPSTLGYLLILQGMAALGAGELERSQTIHEEALDLFRHAGDVKGASTCILHLAAIALVRGNYERVLALGREALHERSDMNDSTMIQLWLLGIGSATLGIGLPARGVRLWGAAEGLGKAHGVRPTPVSLSILNLETRMASARSFLGEQKFMAAWAEGESLSMEQAIESARSVQGGTKTSTSKPRRPEPRKVLTPRQREVARLISRGLTNREIAAELHLSEHTVTTHARDVLRKLGVKSRLRIAAEFREELESP